MNDNANPMQPLYPTPRVVTAERAWLTADQAVRYLGLPSIKALYQAVRRGTVPVCRIGRVLRFFRTDLDAALRGRRGPR